MKASELINYLETVKEEHGDIDVVCMVGNWDWDIVEPNETASAIEETSPFFIDNAGVQSDKFLYLGING